MKSQIRVLLLFTLLALQGTAQTFPTPAAQTVTADPTTGVLRSPSNFLTGNSIPTTSEINGWFADPSTNGSFSASAWRTDLGLVIGTNVQAYDADLTAWAGVNPSSYSTTAQIAAAYQPLDADLTDLADGSLSGSKVGTGIDGTNITTGTVADARIASTIARDSEVTSAISALSSVYQPLDTDLTAWAGVNPSSYSTTSQIAAAYQPLDADLTDLADGSLSGSKVGTGIDGTNITTGTVADARIASTIARDSEVTSAISALSSVYQPLDTDLTAWAGVNPSSYSTTAAINGWFADPSTNGSFSASAWRTDLGLLIGTNVQAYDADLTDLADGSLSGSKVGTGINADNITGGTLADARLGSSVARRGAELDVTGSYFTIGCWEEGEVGVGTKYTTDLSEGSVRMTSNSSSSFSALKYNGFYIADGTAELELGTTYIYSGGQLINWPQGPGTLGIIVDAPASASSTGTAGQVAYDSGYIYVCIATDTWKRAPLASW